MQLTLAILKPDIFIHGQRVQNILKIIKESGFKCLASRKLWLDHNESEEFYKMHKGKFFYNRLKTFMSSGDMMALVLERDDAILKWREMLGPTSPYRARQLAPNSIRALYGISDTRNVGHGSDCDETAQREVNFFFPEFNVDEWNSKNRSKDNIS
eukprot:Seg997.3 transcript_id=Seg997.3/GoldUCD/mRNA.D3Y31 product="Nucleoside diphosphate kinase 6" protein_id=Seg997.3/GoldUCD/D3Y31